MIASLPGMDYSFKFSAYGFPTHTLANPGTGGLIQVCWLIGFQPIYQADGLFFESRGGVFRQNPGRGGLIQESFASRISARAAVGAPQERQPRRAYARALIRA